MKQKQSTFHVVNKDKVKGNREQICHSLELVTHVR